MQLLIKYNLNVFGRRLGIQTLDVTWSFGAKTHCFGKRSNITYKCINHHDVTNRENDLKNQDQKHKNKQHQGFQTHWSKLKRQRDDQLNSHLFKNLTSHDINFREDWSSVRFV